MAKMDHMAIMATELPTRSSMSAQPLRNRRGENAASFSATHAKNALGSILDAVAVSGMAVITKRDVPKAVVLSMDEYRALAGSGRETLATLDREFDQLLAGMQAPKARKGLKSAFDATPAELGVAAVGAARGNG